jgi:type IV pilus assembly protein PilZ
MPACSDSETTMTEPSHPADPTNPHEPALPKSSVMSLTIRDRTGLYAAYMPFLKPGGIFVPGVRTCQIGDEVFVLLTLMQDETRYPIAGTVAWMTPEGAAQRTPGVGVAFPDDESGLRVRRRIEELLGTALASSRPTHTI